MWRRVVPTSRVNSAGKGRLAALIRLSSSRGAILVVLSLGICFSWTGHKVAASDDIQAPDIARLIDREIDQRLLAEQMPASDRSSDSEFCRRVHVDIIGRIPTYDETVAFLDSKAADKRSKLIDALLDRPEYGQHWATMWSNLSVTRSDASQLAAFHRSRFHEWLAKRLNANSGWDSIVTALLTAEGSLEDVPAAAFLQSYSGNNLQPQPERIAGAVSELFLGIQLKCAECHNHRGEHAVNEWKHGDLWGMAAFFGRLRNQAADKDTNASAKTILTEGDVPKGKALQDSTFQAPRPILPGGLLEIPDPSNSTRFLSTPVKARFLETKEEPNLSAAGPYRGEFAAWMTAPQNPYFARALVNRLWAHFMGRGLVNPIAEMHKGNPPSHPQLLQGLSEEFVASGFDLKHLIRGIVSSAAYQRTSRVLPANAKDRQWLSHMALKPLRPEVLFDSLQLVTKGNPSAPPPIPPKPSPSPTPRETFAQFFGSKEWDADSTDLIYGIPQFLKLMNVSDGGPVLAKLLGLAGDSREKAIENLYLAALSRRPTATEAKTMLDHVNQAPNATTGYCEIYWALLNSAEFLLNH